MQKYYGPVKTLYNRWKRWGAIGISVRMMEGLAATFAEPKTVMIDATQLKAHRTASSLRAEKGFGQHQIYAVTDANGRH